MIHSLLWHRCPRSAVSAGGGVLHHPRASGTGLSKAPPYDRSSWLPPPSLEGRTAHHPGAESRQVGL